jgi:hypothetical protein
MRFLTTPNILFTDINGNIFQVKDKRDIPNYNLLAIYNKNADEDMDEIIVRPEFYGEGQEALNYLLVDFNPIAFLENN